MKEKAIGLGIILLVFAACRLGPKIEPETNFEETRVYRNIAMEEIWKTSLDAIRKTGFSVKVQQKDTGIIDARKNARRNNRDIVTVMNVFVDQEENRIKVKCLVSMPGMRVDVDECRLYGELFFKHFNKMLEF